MEKEECRGWQSVSGLSQCLLHSLYFVLVAFVNRKLCQTLLNFLEEII